MNYYLRSMTRHILLVGMFLLCALAGWAQVYQDGVRKGQIKVKFSPAMTTSLGQMKVNARSTGLTTGIEKLDAAAKKTGATNMYRLFPYDAKYEHKLRKHGLHLWYVVELKDNVNPKTAVAQFKQLQEVTVAEVEREKVLAPHTMTPYTPGASTFATLPFNDPFLKDQWHYDNTGQSGFADADINLFEAWTKTAGASDIIVSIHDQGVDVSHSDLKANLWTNLAELNGTAGIDDDENGYVDDVNGYNFEKNKGALDAQFHGTHVAGTIAAVNNNGIGVSGVAGGSGNNDGVKIMSLQIFGGAPVEKTYVYAANNGAVISQNSWGYSQPGYFDQSVLDAIDYFVAEAGDYPGSPMKGGIVIFAAGNSNLDADWYPGYHSSILTVASIGPEWKKATYSNFGDWVEISAPGGDQQYGSKSGVLSTYPKNQYAYLQGTSMACPHVSGIAALALANRDHQLTNTELWDKLLTGVVGIDQNNQNYIGKLGTGAIDAALAIQNDQGIAPQAITDLNITGIAQEFATLAWTVPADNDDTKPFSFELYYHTQPITSGNLTAATKTVIKNEKAAGDEYSYEINGLLGVTTYYFAITSTDRWGNVSVLSNVITETTNQGPSIAVDENSQNITLEIDASASTTATHDITILNEASGILRWNHFMRHSNTSLSFNSSSLHYPVVTKKKSSSEIKVAPHNAHHSKVKLRSTEPTASAYTAIEKSYSDYITNIVGETDTALTNSAAARFYVGETSGFNLTQVHMYLKHDPAKGPVIVEVYKGTSPTKNNLIYAQEHNNYGTDEEMAYITLNEQLYFESGSTFWIAFHVPSGNLYPLGIGYESDPSYSTNCFMSFDLGGSWAPLEDLLNSKEFAWGVTAASYNEHLGTYLTLEPGSGDVDGNGETMATLTASAATLSNGTYTANLVLASNDAQHQELRIPVNLTVSGHKPKIKHIDIADYGSVFQGTEKTLELVLENEGYGNFNDPIFNISNSAFSMVGYAPWQIGAREEVVVKIKFSPSSTGNINGVLDFTNGDQSYQISLFGVGAETSKMSITPENQVVNNVALGDVVNAQVTVENTGAYPLKYFIPGYDSKGVSDNWPSDYHTYGYKFRTSYASEANPIAYAFQDISGTGINITESIKKDQNYAEVDMGFDFPYYGQAMQKLYIANKGFTTFDNSVNPINTPSLNNSYNPKGYISPLGSYFDYVSQGNVFYQVEADRVIVQYDNVWDGYNPETITAQMVLYANGDIRFFYDNMGFTTFNQNYLTILIEDVNQTDGISVHNYEHPIELYSGLALGFDYPGPDIITHVENGSGILAPGSSAIVDFELSTASLAEGTINRYINFISNDPTNAAKNALVQLNITSGGIPQPLVSADTIAFGNVFQEAVRSSIFTIKNPGTANVDISSINFVTNDFTLDGDVPATIKPGLYKKYEVGMPTGTLGALEDWLSINYTDGSHDTIYVTGNVVVAPAINIDLSVLQKTLAYGETSSQPFTIENTGLAPLEVTAVGKQWLSFDAPTAVVSNGYSYEKHNNGDFYQWIDIRKSGTQMPFMEDASKEDFWRELTLPFPIEYFGQTYSDIKIGENGIVSLEEDPEMMFFPDQIPTASNEGKYIMPYWTFGGFNTMFYPAEEVGIFYQIYDDKVIITWSYLINNFGGMGDPVSAQLFLYRNGTMKFQYKVEGSNDLTSKTTSIGLQENTTGGLSISDHLNVDHGNGLAFIILPAKKLVINPGTTLSGFINIDAKNIYGGVYNETLKIQTNVPGSEYLEKPVELTVTGEGVFAAANTVDFGTKMIAFEFGSPVINVMPLNFSNEGSAPFDITWAQMADATQGLSLQLYMLVDGWFGPEWQWVDIANAYSPWAWETPVFTVNPGDKVMARAIFYPSVPGEFTDELVLTTSLGEKRIELKGSSVEPPLMEAITTPINVVMNTMNETATRSIEFNNLNGKSNLEYEVSIDFGRATTSRATTETMASAVQQNYTLSAKKAGTISGARIASTYNRILKYTQRDTPDAHAGTGGGAPLTVATKYNAGPQGFNLSHVETWFRTETLDQGTLHVEIRAGGNSIANAVTLSESTLDFTGSGDDETGAWHQIAMNEPVGIYPNEDFYVLVTLPLGIERPQGVVNDEETIEGRYYYYEEEGSWSDIQEVPGFETSGWLMYAAEETAGNSSWLSITSDLSGTLAPGESISTSLHMEGPYAKRGDQVANIVIKTNDPTHATVKVPVTLHMNEAPHFTGVPENVHLAEKETITIDIGVVDAEGNTVTLRSSQIYPGVTHTFSGGVLSIVLAPDYGFAGNFHYTFIATDEYAASSEVTVFVEVVHTNRAPVYMGDESLEYYSAGHLMEYDIADFFSDPDGDQFTFTVSSGNTELVDVFASAGQFLVKPISGGETTLAFTATDSYGAVTRDTIAVRVNNVLGLEEEINAGLKVYPNPVQQFAQVILSHEWKGIITLEVIDAAGKQHVVQHADAGLSRDIQLDVSGLRKGFYILRATSSDQRKSIKLIKD